MERRKLILKRDVLVELRTDELRAVVAALPRVGAHARVDTNAAHTINCVVQGCTCYCA